MRGKDLWNVHRPPRPGITPAYAGKSHIFEERTRANKDHPRLCGEKVPAGNAYSIVRGSPPPMRGKVSFGVVEDVLDRITPAYAGKS